MAELTENEKRVVENAIIMLYCARDSGIDIDSIKEMKKLINTYMGEIEMPYKIERRGNTWLVVKKDDRKVMGTHPSKEKAQAQIKAIYANEKK